MRRKLHGTNQRIGGIHGLQFNQCPAGGTCGISVFIARDGAHYDIQFKGSGPTLYSRNGDGRAALGPVLREYLVSEAMNALGIPTTRALMAATTGERVYRDAVLPVAPLVKVLTWPYVATTATPWASLGLVAIWGAIGLIIASWRFRWTPRRG